MSLSSQRGYRSFSPSLTSDLLAVPVPVPVPCSKFPIRSDRDTYTVLNYTGFRKSQPSNNQQSKPVGVGNTIHSFIHSPSPSPSPISSLCLMWRRVRVRVSAVQIIRLDIPVRKYNPQLLRGDETISLFRNRRCVVIFR